MSSAFDRIRGNRLLLIAAVVAVSIATYGAGAGAAGGGAGAGAAGGGGAGASGAAARAGVTLAPNSSYTFSVTNPGGSTILNVYTGTTGNVLAYQTPFAFGQNAFTTAGGLGSITGSTLQAANIGAQLGYGAFTSAQISGLAQSGATIVGSAGAAGGASLSLSRTALTGALYFLSTLGGQEGGESGTPTTTINAENTATQWAIGRVRKAGLLCYLSYDADSLYQALVLSEGECESIDRVFVRTRGEFEFRRVRPVFRTSTDQGLPANTRYLYEWVDDPTSNYLVAREDSPYYYTDPIVYDRGPDTGGQTRELIVHQSPRSALEIYEYFDADGSQGQEMIDEVRGTRTGLRWDRAHRLTNKSWVFVKSTQPSYDLTSRDDFINRFWQQAPDITFEMKGIKTTWPGQTTPAWTENVAAIYYWWLTKRRGFNPSVINVDAFNAAYAKCNEQLSLEGLETFRDDLPRTTSRYTCGGTISSTGGVTQVQSQLNLAMAGELQHYGGQIFIKPGSDELPVATIDSSMVISEPEISIFSDSAASFNSVSSTLQQNRYDEFGQHTIPDLDDFEVIRYEDDPTPPAVGETREQYLSRGGRYAGTETKKTRTIGFSLINDPVSAVNNMIITLRQRRASMNVNLSIMAGRNLELLNLRVGNKILLDIPEAIERNKAFRINSISFSANGVIELQVNEWPDGLFDDTIVLPPVPIRGTRQDAPIDAPTNLKATLTPVITSTGNANYRLNVSWDSSGYNTAIYINRIGGDFTPVWEVRGGNEYETTLFEPGSYMVEARHIDIYGGSSSVAGTEAVLLQSSIPVPTPRLENTNVRSGVLRSILRGTGNRNISNVDVRAVYAADQQSMPSIDALNNTQWLNYDKINSQLNLPADNNDDIEVISNFNRSGWYRIAIRYVDAFNRLSTILDLGTHRISLPATPTISFHSHPQWAGVMNNFYRWTHDSNEYLIPDQPMARTMTNDEWRGVDDKPFGDSPDAYFESAQFDLEQIKDVNITCEAVIDTIDGRAAGAVSYEILIHNHNTDAFVRFPFTPGTPIPATTRYVKARVSVSSTENNTRIRDLIISVEDR